MECLSSRSIVIEDLRLHLRKETASKGVVAFHYCSYDSLQMRDPTTILGTVLQQMIEELPHDSGALLNLDTAMIRLVREMDRIPDVIIKMASAFDQVYIILDAFDECDEDHRRRLRPILKLLKTHIKVMIISRDIQDIRNYFRDEPLHIKIRAGDVQADITAFLRKTVCSLDDGSYTNGRNDADDGNDADDLRLVLPAGSVKDEITDELSVRAKGK